jgi:succinate dehydrogenase (ubiquinone) cytochrome b560 subunit
VAAVASLPVVVKVTAKLALALPFFFHSYNGIRHLTWDFGLGMANKTVAKTGWTVVALTVVSSLYTVFLA